MLEELKEKTGEHKAMQKSTTVAVLNIFSLSFLWEDFLDISFLIIPLWYTVYLFMHCMYICASYIKGKTPLPQEPF